MSSNSYRISKARARNIRIKNFVDFTNTLILLRGFYTDPKEVIYNINEAQIAIDIQKVELDYLLKHEPSSEEVAELYKEFLSLVEYKNATYYEAERKFGF